MSRDCIISRLDAALEKARWQGVGVKAIYLDQDDANAFDAAVSAAFAMKLHCLAYKDHHIRYGERSRVFTDSGSEIAVPKMLSAKVRA